MKKRIIELSEEQQKALQMVYATTKNATYRKRCHAVLLKSQGRTSKDVGKIIGVHAITVNNCLNRYEAEGINGLKTKAGQGRKPILNKQDDSDLVKQAVCQERQRLKLVKAELEKTLDKHFSIKTLKRFLKNLAAHGNV